MIKIWLKCKCGSEWWLLPKKVSFFMAEITCLIIAFWGVLKREPPVRPTIFSSITSSSSIGFLVIDCTCLTKTCCVRQIQHFLLTLELVHRMWLFKTVQLTTKKPNSLTMFLVEKSQNARAMSFFTQSKVKYFNKWVWHQIKHFLMKKHALSFTKL